MASKYVLRCTFLFRKDKTLYNVSYSSDSKIIVSLSFIVFALSTITTVVSLILVEINFSDQL